MKEGYIDIETSSPPPKPKNKKSDAYMIFIFSIIVCIACAIIIPLSIPNYGDYDNAEDYADSLISVSSITINNNSIISSLYSGEVCFFNASENTIKYITFGLVAYNRVGDKIENYKAETTFVGPFEKDNLKICEVESDFASSPVHSMKFYKIEIEYSDGKKISFDNKMLAHVNSNVTLKGDK